MRSFENTIENKVMFSKFGRVRIHEPHIMLLYDVCAARSVATKEPALYISERRRRYLEIQCSLCEYSIGVLYTTYIYTVYIYSQSINEFRIYFVYPMLIEVHFFATLSANFVQLVYIRNDSLKSAFLVYYMAS